MSYVADSNETQEQAVFGEAFASQVDRSITWSVIAWLKSITDLPIWVKVLYNFCALFVHIYMALLLIEIYQIQGIVNPQDAQLAVEHGVDVIVCSNHGGRQLDTCVATSKALPRIVSAVGGRIPVVVDGGIRRGTDIFKVKLGSKAGNSPVIIPSMKTSNAGWSQAIALGASGVLLGRSVVFALAVGGQPCVEAALDLICQEFKLAMALSGCTSTQQINDGLLWKD